MCIKPQERGGGQTTSTSALTLPTLELAFLGIVRGAVLVYLKTNHGLRCAKRFGVRVAGATAFLSIYSNCLLALPRAMPTFAEAFAQFPYGARTESGGGCHTHSKTLRESISYALRYQHWTC